MCSSFKIQRVENLNSIACTTLGAVQELGKVWLDSTFVDGVYEELAHSVESKNLAFQAVSQKDGSENGKYQKR